MVLNDLLEGQASFNWLLCSISISQNLETATERLERKLNDLSDCSEQEAEFAFQRIGFENLLILKLKMRPRRWKLNKSGPERHAKPSSKVHSMCVRLQMQSETLSSKDQKREMFLPISEQAEASDCKQLHLEPRRQVLGMCLALCVSTGALQEFKDQKCSL